MSDVPMQEFLVARDADRLEEYRDVGIAQLYFKVSTGDSHGSLLVIEMTHHAKGGPGRHLHYDQDEWFYVVEGEYVFEIGGERIRLKPGDSVFGPRNVPHVWAFVGERPGRILFIFTPAGKAEAFFRDSVRTDGGIPQDPAYFRAYGMELVGPPLDIE